MENNEVIVLAGGCFWCTEAVFQRIEGVEKVVSGYTGGAIKNPGYREVCTGRTGHAEAVKITFNKNVVSLNVLLEVFFGTHDPTTLDRQGNDFGNQYRSAIFYTTDEQKIIAENCIANLKKEKGSAEIVTEIVPLGIFYEAEKEHSNYFNENGRQPYCEFVISPKIKKIKTYFSNKLKTDSNL